MSDRIAYSGWVPYMNSDRSIQGLKANSSSLSEAMVFAYDFDGHGDLKPGESTLAVLAAARSLAKRPARLYVTIVNDTDGGERLIEKDGAMTHRVLSDPGNRRRLVEQIGKIAGPVDGIDIDFENMEYADRDNFTAFIAELAQSLHRRGKLLSITVEPKTQDLPLDESGKPRSQATPDWPALVGHVDTFRIMAYFFHWQTGAPGAIAAPKDVFDLATFALRTVPKKKLSIALCFWGLDWPEDGAASEIHFAQAQALAAAHKAAILRDPESESPHFTYREGKIKHEVWFDDAQSIRAKLEVLQKLGISKVSFWEMSTGDPDFWKASAADH